MVINASDDCDKISVSLVKVFIKWEGFLGKWQWYFKKLAFIKKCSKTHNLQS